MGVAPDVAVLAMEKPLVLVVDAGGAGPAWEPIPVGRRGPPRIAKPSVPGLQVARGPPSPGSLGPLRRSP